MGLSNRTVHSRRNNSMANHSNISTVDRLLLRLSKATVNRPSRSMAHHQEDSVSRRDHAG